MTAPHARSVRKRVTHLLRYWLTFEGRVDRRRYLGHGLALMLVKYGVDALLVGLGTGTFWTPLDYLQAAPFLVTERLADAPPYLASVLALWTLPFLWIGMTMTIRRLLDAGRSAWWSLLFFIPLLNYLLLGVSAALGSAGARSGDERPVRHGERLPSALLSIAFGGSLGLALLWLAVFWIESYGLALFMGTPFVIGLATAFVLCRRYPATSKEALEVVTMTMLVLVGAAFVVGFEGAVCLLMYAPLGLLLALMGGSMGRFLASVGESPGRGALLIGLLFPGTAALEVEPASTLREVESSVVVDALPAEVWDRVVAFPPIPEPTSPMFRMGIAYPTHAEIEGSGIGAVRYCHFSTGPFVEPITAWEPGVRLAFDVRSSPRPLEELSFLDVAPPHLEGYLVPRAGEFRLVPLGDGRTRLEGSTWYEQRLRPEGYWVLFSDYLIGRIHQRVLEHIRVAAESAGPG